MEALCLLFEHIPASQLIPTAQEAPLQLSRLQDQRTAEELEY